MKPVLLAAAEVQAVCDAQQWHAEWTAIAAHVVAEQLQYRWCLRLRLTEESKDRQHPGGFEFWVFREFVLASPNASPVRRLVFGYD